MKHFVFSLALLWAFACQGQVLLSQAQTDTLTRRIAVQGRYYKGGSGYTNSPADGATLVANANTFLAQPIWAGSGVKAPNHASVYTGMPLGVPNNSVDGYPTWHLYLAKDAATLYHANHAKYYALGMKVKQVLLMQIDVSSKPFNTNRTTYLPNWTGLKLTMYDGTQEAAWMSRFIVCSDLVRPLCTTAERTRIDNYIAEQAFWLANREATAPNWITALLPNWLTGDFTVRGYFAAATLPSYLGEAWNKADAANPREAVWAAQSDGGGYLYTHRKANGALGHRIAKAHYFLNNQSSIRMQFVSLAAAVLPAGHPRKAYLTNVGLRYCEAYLVLSTYRDGTTSEQLRANDYGIVGEGLAYNSHNVQTLLINVQSGLQRGDSTLFKFTTSAGCWGSEGGAKSVRLVMQRIADVITDTLTYNGSVSSANRVSEFAPARVYNCQSFRAAYLPHSRYQLLWAAKFWPNSRFAQVGKGLASGQLPIPTVVPGVNEIRNNGPVADPWRGAFADWLPYHLIYAD